MDKTGLTVEWAYDGAIVIYTLHNSTPPVIDAWIETGIRNVEDWRPTQPYLALHDFSSPHTTLTTYARQRTRSAVLNLPKHLSRSAAVIPKNLFGEIIRLYTELEMKRLTPFLERKIFFNREEALAWLAELIPPKEAMKPPQDDHFQKIYAGTQTQLYDTMSLAEDVDGNLTAYLHAHALGKVVDVGTGTGRVGRLLQAEQLIALDLNLPMLKTAQRHLAGKLVQADVLNLPIQTGWADTAIEGWALGHFCGWFADWQTLIDHALEEMRRVSKHQILIETLGTGTEQPTPPTETLAQLFAYWENEQGFERTVLRTDYQFASLEQGRELVNFFFGAELAQQMTSPHLIEWTGVWRR